MRRRFSVLHAVLLLAAVALPHFAARPWPLRCTGGNCSAGSSYKSNLPTPTIKLSKNLFASVEYSLLISGTNITSTDVAGYDRAVTELLNATVRYAVENSTRLFATGQRVGNDTGFSNIFS